MFSSHNNCEVMASSTGRVLQALLLACFFIYGHARATPQNQVKSEDKTSELGGIGVIHVGSSNGVPVPPTTTTASNYAYRTTPRAPTTPTTPSNYGYRTTPRSSPTTPSNYGYRTTPDYNYGYRTTPGYTYNTAPQTRNSPTTPSSRTTPYYPPYRRLSGVVV